MDHASSHRSVVICLTCTRRCRFEKERGKREREERGRVAREPRRVRKTRGDLRSRGHTRTGADAHTYKGRRRDALAVILARRHPSRGTCRRSSSSSVTDGRHPRNRNSWEQIEEEPLVRTRISTPGTRQEAFRLLDGFEENTRVPLSRLQNLPAGNRADSFTATGEQFISRCVPFLRVLLAF